MTLKFFLNFSVFIKILNHYFNPVQSFEFLYHRVMKEKENFMEATSMDKNKLLKQ